VNQVSKLESLRARKKTLDETRIRTEARLADLQANLVNLFADMKEKFGVDTIEALRALHEKMRQSADDRLAAFEQSLTGVENMLRQVQAAEAEA
jgi:chaperonin cofactor prefoldin